MGLRDVMDEMPPLFRGGHVCQTCVALDSLEGDDRVALLEWLGDRSKTARTIHVALAAYGVEVPWKSIQRHRRECVD